MLRRMPLAVCLLAVPCLGGERGRSAPAYTNADLERYAAGRGADEQPPPAAASASERTREAASERERSRDEAYWRGEAERLRRRLLPLRLELAELTARLERAEALPLRSTSREALRERRTAEAARQRDGARVEALRARLRDEEIRFHDRARQAAALPGWTRSAFEP